MEYKWILSKGTCTDIEISQIIVNHMESDYLYLAGCTDSYHSGKNDLSEFLEKKSNDLLELRVFNKDRELLFTRSMTGRNFQWRLTNDNKVDKNEYMDTVQYIDINTEVSNNINPECSYAAGENVKLYTTVGGVYSLPIQPGDNAAEIRTYIAYDDDGMAYAADYRVKGFVHR